MTQERIIEIAEELENIINESVFDVYSEEEKTVQEAINLLYRKADDM